MTMNTMDSTSASYWEAVKLFATETQAEYIDATHLHTPPRSHSLAAEHMGVDRRAVDRAIQRAVDTALEEGGILAEPEELDILVIDIETAPLLAYVWSLWSEARSTEAIEEDCYVLSFSYKWLGSDTTYSKTLRECKSYQPFSEDDSELLMDMWQLFNKADIVIAHNGDKFDIKHIKTRMLIHTFDPPSPFRTVDTLKICKREFKFTSNRLDYVAQKLLGMGKLPHTGMELWKGCKEENEESWALMREYNRRDVEILEKVYCRIRAWDRSHPNIAVKFDSAEKQCGVCGSLDMNLEPGVTAATNVSLFEVYRCGNCGHVMRGRQNIRSKDSMKEGLINAR